MLAPHQPGTVKQADSERRYQHEIDQRFAALLLKHGPQRSHDQCNPQEQSDQQVDLPEPAKVDIFIALMTEPEIGRQIVEETVDCRPLPGKRADHDDQQADEQEIDPEPLKFGIAADKHWRDIESGGEPSGGNPQDRQLRVPSARNRIGQIFGERQAIEPLSLNRVMSGDNAQQHLRDEQGADHPEVFGRCAHRRGDDRPAQYIGSRHALFGQYVAAPEVKLLGIIGDQSACCCQQQNDRGQTPQQRACCRDIADQRFVRPIAGIGYGVAGAVGCRAPGRPEIECRNLPRLFRRQLSVDREGIGFAQRQRGGVIAFVEADEMRLHLFDGRCAGVTDRDDPGCRIIAVGAHFLLQRRFVHRFILRRSGACNGVRTLQSEQSRCLTVQPVRAPVGREIAAMAPDRALLHAADRLPDILTGLDIRARKQGFAARGFYCLGNGRCLLIDLLTKEQQGAEHSDHANDQDGPKPFNAECRSIAFHGRPPEVQKRP